jgi:hypothetical protein
MAKEQKVTSFSDSEGKFDYWVQICNDLDPSVLPNASAYQFGASAMRMDRSTGRYEAIAFHDSQTYQFKEPHNPNSGFVVLSWAERVNSIGPERLFYVFQQISCDPNTSSTDPIATPTVYYSGELSYLWIQYRNKWGCPIPTTIPTPRPEKTCGQTYLSRFVPGLGINLNLRDLDQEPRGFAFAIDSTNYALVKTCGESDCPQDMFCDAQTSSIWVCSPPNNCTSFGIFSDISLLEDDPDEGFMVSYKTSGYKYTNISMVCQFELESGMPRFTAAIMKWGIGLDLVVHSDVACTRPVSQQATGCQANLSDSRGVNLYVNLTESNKKGGWRWNATISAWSVRGEAVWQPCGAVVCPYDDCLYGGEGVFWFCRDQMCDEYGILENGVHIRSWEAHELARGVEVFYSGGQDRSMAVHIECDEAIAPHEFVFDGEIGVSQGSELLVRAWSSDVCVAPPPEPTGTMRMPSPSASPSASEPAPPHQRRKVTGGGYFLIVVGSGTVLYLVGGIALGYFWYGECGCPCGRFWREFLMCVIWGVKGLMCMKPWRSGPDTLWGYETIGGYERV